MGNYYKRVVMVYGQAMAESNTAKKKELLLETKSLCEAAIQDQETEDRDKDSARSLLINIDAELSKL